MAHVLAYRVVRHTADRFAVETLTDLGHWRTTDEFSSEAEAEAKKTKLEKIASASHKSDRLTFR